MTVTKKPKPISPAQLVAWREGQADGKGARLTQERAATHFGVTRRSLMRYEAGETLVPGWLTRFVRDDYTIPGYSRTP